MTEQTHPTTKKLGINKKSTSSTGEYCVAQKHAPTSKVTIQGHQILKYCICCKWHVNVAKSLLLSILPSFLPSFFPSFLSFLPSFLPFYPSFLLSFLSSVLPSFLSSFLPSFLWDLICLICCWSMLLRIALFVHLASGSRRKANWSKVFLCRLLPAKLSRLQFSVS